MELKWYQKTWVIVLFLIFLWPVGIVLVFLSPWKKSVKIAVAIIVAVLGIFSISFARGFLSGNNASNSINQQETFYGVSYKVDSTWQRSDDSSTSRTYLIDDNDAIYLEASDYTGYDISASEDYLIESSQSALESTYDLTTSLSTEKMTLGSYDACRFDWKMKDSSGTELTMTEYLIFFDDYVVTVTFGGQSNTYSSVSTQYTVFADSLSAGGDGSFATASTGGDQTGSASSDSTGSSSSTSSGAPLGILESVGGSGSSSGSGGSSSGSGTTNAYKTQATTFQDSLPSYCAVVTAADMNTTDPADAKASVYFYGYADSTKSTIVCYGTYYVLDSAATAEADFNSTVQATINTGAPEGTRVDGDDKNVWTCTWNGVYFHIYRKDNVLLTVAGSQDSMEYIQTLISQLSC